MFHNNSACKWWQTTNNQVLLSRIAMFATVCFLVPTIKLNSWKLKPFWDTWREQFTLCSFGGSAMMSRLGLHAQIRWQTSRKRYVNICHSMYFYLKHVWKTHARQLLFMFNWSCLVLVFGNKRVCPLYRHLLVSSNTWHLGHLWKLWIAMDYDLLEDN